MEEISKFKVEVTLGNTLFKLIGFKKILKTDIFGDSVKF